jgi:hypothetical protein
MSIYSILALFLIFVYLAFIGVRGIIRDWRDGKLSVKEDHDVLLAHAEAKATNSGFVIKTLKEIDAFGTDAKGEKNSQKAGAEFERYVCSLYNSIEGHKAYLSHDFVKMKGIHVAGFDGGADVIVEEYDIRDVLVRRVVVQCKHYTDNVDAKAVDAAATSQTLYRATKARVVTNVGFTKAAIQKAKLNDVDLVGRNQLAELIARAGQSPLLSVKGEEFYQEDDDNSPIKPSFD